jgi:hypothetical protein
MKDVKIENTTYFPCPSNQYKELSPISKEWGEYCKAWIWNGMSIIASVGNYDGKEWLHISFSRKTKMPTYAEMQMIKKDFIGEDKKAIFVLPKKERYVNINKNCLHLWYCANDGLPDFDCGLGTI